MVKKIITLNSYFELATFRAMLELADATWFGDFPINVERQLFRITKVDERRQVSLDKLSDLLIKWDKQTGGLK